MSSINDKRNQFRHLRAEYDLSFRRWEDEVRSLELLTSQPKADAKAVERAQLRVAEAQDVYRENRNRLAQFLVNMLGMASDHAASKPAAAGVSSTDAATAQAGRLSQLLQTAHERSLEKDCDRVAELVR